MSARAAMSLSRAPYPCSLNTAAAASRIRLRVRSDFVSCTATWSIMSRRPPRCPAPNPRAIRTRRRSSSVMRSGPPQRDSPTRERASSSRPRRAWQVERPLAPTAGRLGAAVTTRPRGVTQDHVVPLAHAPTAPSTRPTSERSGRRTGPNVTGRGSVHPRGARTEHSAHRPPKVGDPTGPCSLAGHPPPVCAALS